jgi:hypothetical protein
LGLGQRCLSPYFGVLGFQALHAQRQRDKCQQAAQPLKGLLIDDRSVLVQPRAQTARPVWMALLRTIG